MAFSLKDYIDNSFGGNISEISDKEFSAIIEKICEQPYMQPALTLKDVKICEVVEIPVEMSGSKMWEIFGVYHLRWSVLDDCACEGCKAMDGAIYDHHMASIVEKRKHLKCRCRWIPLDVLRGRQKLNCLLPDANIQNDFLNCDDLSRIYAAEKFFPGYTPPAPVPFDLNNPFNHEPAYALSPDSDINKMDGYFLLDCIDKTEESGVDASFIVSLLDIIVEQKRISPNTKAKVCKRRSELLLTMGKDLEALSSLEKALEYNPKAPVKRQIAQLRKKIGIKI